MKFPKNRLTRKNRGKQTDTKYSYIAPKDAIEEVEGTFSHFKSTVFCDLLT